MGQRHYSRCQVRSGAKLCRSDSRAADGVVTASGAGSGGAGGVYTERAGAASKARVAAGSTKKRLGATARRVPAAGCNECRAGRSCVSVASARCQPAIVVAEIGTK